MFNFFSLMLYLYRKNKLMEPNVLKVVTIDADSMLCTCDNGNEYPLMSGLENITIDELQKFINTAREATIGILKQLNKDNG